MTQDADLFAPESQLPVGYGLGMSERAVEFGWAMAQNPRGRVLDAGSTFNHPYALDAILPIAETLTIATLTPEPCSYPERGATYVYEDLRSLPFVGGAFDTVMSLSVLEHVGLDTSLYGAKAAPADDPQAEARRAMRELARVVRPGGTLLFSVPFGRAESHGWVRVLDLPAVLALIAVARPAAHVLQVYHDTGRGWQRVAAEDAAGARYRTYQAEAVACVRLEM